MRRVALYTLTVLAPFALLALLELVLRLSSSLEIPVWHPVAVGQQHYLVANPALARRYFPNEDHPPAPPADLFASTKPARGFRVFVLGESTAAGFPYPPNGTFSRVVRDALHDLLPGDSVEVVNLGIAATNSYTMIDLAGDVIAQHPDAVLIYAGHNEYYGALGVGSSIRLGSSPALIRASLRLERLRTVMLLERSVTALRRNVGKRVQVDSTSASFMESVAANQQIELDSPAYRSGLAQFEDNLSILLGQFHDAHVPVFIGSIASNERSQRPFVSPANDRARIMFDSATRLLAGGDTVRARNAFARARDLDVIRFRAPAAINDTIRAVAQRTGAHYVPVAEAFHAASPGAIPGAELFLEHVHPNRHGYALIARAFVETLQHAPFAAHPFHPERLASWDKYEERMAITAFDERIVHHTIQSLVTRWPFVERTAALDYRGTYRPAGMADSLALLVSRGGMPWGDAKLRLAEYLEASHHPAEALSEYTGLLRDRPLAEPPYRLIGRTLVALGQHADAVPYLQHAAAMADTWESAYLLGVIALERRDFPSAIAHLDRAVTLAPDAVAPVYQLSLAFGLSKNLAAARGAAARAAKLDPRYSGLAQWMQTLGMPSP